jgi:hypothetical protein
MLCQFSLGAAFLTVDFDDALVGIFSRHTSRTDLYVALHAIRQRGDCPGLMRAVMIDFR